MRELSLLIGHCRAYRLNLDLQARVEGADTATTALVASCSPRTSRRISKNSFDRPMTVKNTFMESTLTRLEPSYCRSRPDGFACTFA